MGKQTSPIERPELVRFLQMLIVQAFCDRIWDARYALYEMVLDDARD